MKFYIKILFPIFFVYYIFSLISSRQDFYTIDDLERVIDGDNYKLMKIDVNRKDYVSSVKVEVSYPFNKTDYHCTLDNLKVDQKCSEKKSFIQDFQIILPNLDSGVFSRIKSLNKTLDVNMFDSRLGYSIYDVVYYGLLIGVLYFTFKLVRGLSNFVEVTFSPNDEEDNKDKDKKKKKSNLLSLFGNDENQFKLLINEETTLDDVKGNYEIKNEIEKYIDMLKNRESYTKVGAKLPRGVLFIGPPGTGKTLLAKAIAGESKVNFINCTGSDFNGMFVGLGTQKIQSLIDLAKENQPCLIFIDEIDSIALSRDAKQVSTHQDSQNTLNKLLYEMDGFDKDMNIMFIGATNRYKVLDKAIIRSGRFDQKIFFENPNKDERKDIFNYYLLKLQVDFDVEEISKYFADKTAGVSSADIANICNQAAIVSAQEKKDKISKIMLEKSYEQVVLGFEKRSRSMTDKEKERVAIHEAGHALIAHTLIDCSPPIKISIIPRGENALGYTQQESDDIKIHSFDKMVNEIAVLMGGRAAEQIVLKSLSSGSADDLERISKLIKTIYLNFGGLDNFAGFLIKDDYNDHTIDKQMYNEMIRINKIIYSQVIDLIKKHKDKIELVKDSLLENEEIFKEKTLELLGSDIENTETIKLVFDERID
jgi:cell division protease FtsH